MVGGINIGMVFWGVVSFCGNGVLDVVVSTGICFGSCFSWFCILVVFVSVSSLIIVPKKSKL